MLCKHLLGLMLWRLTPATDGEPPPPAEATAAAAGSSSEAPASAAVGAEAHETSRVVLPRGRLLPRARTRALLRKTQLPGGNGQRAPTGQQELLTACGASEQRPQKRRLAAG